MTRVSVIIINTSFDSLESLILAQCRKISFLKMMKLFYNNILLYAFLRIIPLVLHPHPFLIFELRDQELYLLDNQQKDVQGEKLRKLCTVFTVQVFSLWYGHLFPILFGNYPLANLKKKNFFFFFL